MTKVIYLILCNIPLYNGFCESKLIIDNTNNTQSIEYFSEVGNSVSSLTFIVFGIVGLFNYNHSVFYYIVMNLMILMGLSSCLHHYYYTNNFWAHMADIICMEQLLTFSLIYMITNTLIINISCVRKLYILIILFGNLTMLIYNHINATIRTNIMISYSGLMIAEHIHILLYFYRYYYSNFYIILKAELFNLIFGGLAIGTWYSDHICFQSIYNITNFHAWWHFFSALTLFNSINLNIIYYAYINNIEYKWISLIKKCPYLFFIVRVTNKKLNISDSSTSINMEDARLINNINEFNHRRIRSYG